MKSKLGSLFTLLALVAGVHQAAAQGTTDFPIATNGAASQAGIFAAFGRTNYLVGIQGDGTTNFTAISAQLISTNGTLLGPRILTGRTGGIPYVAFGGTKFLLVWSDNALVASGGNDQVYGQFVSQAGALVGGSFTFGPTSEEQDMQGGGGSLLAFDGNNYLAVWDTGGFHDSLGGDIHGALFNETGSLVVPFISITSETNGALTPTVAFGKTNYLVVWNNRRPTGPEEYDIYGEFISPNGTPGTAFVISQTPTPSYDPCCAAFDGTNFMVVWDKNIGSASPNTIWNLFGRVVSADGTFPGSEVAMVTNASNQGAPSLAFDGANYLLALDVGAPSPNTQILFQFFNQVAGSIGPQFYLFSPQGANLPFVGGVLYGGSRFEITAVVGGGVGIDSEGEDFSASTGTYAAFLSTNTTAAAVLDYAYSTNANGLTLTITSYSGPGGTVTIPATINNLPVTAIGTNAFYGNTSLTSVIIPISVTNIEYEAFGDCAGLTGVDFQNDAPSTDSTAFNGDNYATAYYLSGATGWNSPFVGIPAALSIPDSLQVAISPPSAITAGALWRVDGGTWQNSGATVSNLSAGSHTVSFNSVSGWTAPASQIVSGSAIWTATALGAYLLQGQFIYTTNNGTITITGYTGSGAVNIPGMINNLPVTGIGQNAFKDLDLTSVTIPDSVTTIGAHAFDTCTALGSVTIGSGVTSIGDLVFQDCFSLTNVTIDNGVTSIGGWMFADCSSLTSVVIPDSVTSIGEEAFSYCTSLTSVMIGNGVTSIGEIAFQGCFSLATITIPASVTSIGDGAFSYTSLVNVFFDGNPPTADSTVFANGYSSTTAYYLPCASGWSSSFGGISAVDLNWVSITANPMYGVVPVSVNFTSPAIDNCGHAITNWIWNFGDGSTSAAQNPSHTYISIGTFSVGLIAANNNGLSVVGTATSIIVSPTTVAFTANPTNGEVPLTVSFTSAGIDSAGNAITSWNWNFGDGSTSTAQNPSHAYTTTGTFSLALIASNNIGRAVAGLGPASITATNLVLNGGFETGDFTGWTLSGDTSNTYVDDGYQSGITPYPGNSEAALGTSSSIGYLSQTLSTAAGATYLLSFWLENPYADPAEFLVSWNGNTLLDTTTIDTYNWTNMQFVVSATGTSTVLQFGFQDNYDNLGLDDISVVSANPGISNFSLSGANLVLNGSNGQSGATYYVLMSSNLALPSSQWTPVATNVLSASGNFTITVTNTVVPNVAQSFYILQTQ